MELRSGFRYLGTCDPLFKCLLNLEVETPTLSLHFGPFCPPSPLQPFFWLGGSDSHTYVTVEILPQVENVTEAWIVCMCVQKGPSGEKTEHQKKLCYKPPVIKQMLLGGSRFSRRLAWCTVPPLEVVRSQWLVWRSTHRPFCLLQGVALCGAGPASWIRHVTSGSLFNTPSPCTHLLWWLYRRSTIQEDGLVKSSMSHLGCASYLVSNQQHQQESCDPLPVLCWFLLYFQCALNLLK